jgi:hypothetical protein
MSEELAAAPSLEEARTWIGNGLDDLDGESAGQIHGLFVDADSRAPTWLIVKQGRVKPALVAAPLRDCAAAAGRVWIAHDRETIRRAPVVDPTRPLLREHELTISAHYGAGETVGRASEVVARPENSVTSQPPDS